MGLYNDYPSKGIKWYCWNGENFIGNDDNISSIDKFNAYIKTTKDNILELKQIIENLTNE